MLDLALRGKESEAETLRKLQTVSSRYLLTLSYFFAHLQSSQVDVLGLVASIIS